MQTEAALTDLFARLGAPDPAQWARSQIEEGIPQLARFLFLRQAWKLVLPNRDSRWIDEQTSVAPEEPGSAIGPALRRALAHGVEPDDLTAIVRGMQMASPHAPLLSSGRPWKS